MRLVLFLDWISVLGVIAAGILLVLNWKEIAGRGTRWLILFLLLFTFAHNLGNLIFWMEINLMESLEDNILILTIGLWAFVFYSLYRHQAENELVDREERLRLTLFGTRAGIWDWNLVRDELIIDAGWAEILGYSLEELQPMDSASWERLVHPRDYQRSQEMIAEHLAGETQYYEAEVRLRALDGRWTWVLDKGKVIEWTQEGKPLRMTGTIQDIEKLKQAEHALEESDAKFKMLFDAVNDAVIIHDLQGRILEVNQTACQRLGYSRAELLKMTPKDLDTDPYEALLEQRIETLQQQGYLVAETEHQTKNGELIPTEISSKIIDYEEKPAVLTVARDITERKQAQNSMLKQSKYLESLREVGLDLVSELDLDSLLVSIVQKAVNLVGGSAGGFNRLFPERGVLDLDVKIGYRSLPGDTELKKGEGLIGRVWERGEAISVDDYTAWDEHNPAWEESFGHRAVVGVPVNWRGKMLGVLEILREEGHPFVEEDVWILEHFANQAAVAIHNAQLFENAEQRLKRLRSLRDIDRAISGSLDIGITLNLLISSLLDNLEVDAGAILLYQPELQTFKVSVGKGFVNQSLEKTTIRMGEGYAGRAAMDRRIIRVPDLTLETISQERAKLISREGFVSYFGVPLIAKGEIVGVLEVFHRSILQPSQEWIGFLETLASQAAIAIDNLNLFDKLNQSNKELAAAYQGVIESWARSLEIRNLETQGHSRRVTELTVKLAKELGVKGDQLLHIRQGAILHDIGKMGVPDKILHKTGKLTEEEWEEIKKHPLIARELLLPIQPLQPALPIPWAHHEKWDGSGYPRGLGGEKIPLPARIFAVVDVWDALRSDRPYREAWTDQQALNYIREQAGKHFDSRVVDAFMGII